MGTIQERTKNNGRKVYKAVIRIKGYPTMTASFDRKSDAKQWIQEHEPNMKKGKHIKEYEASKHTVSELIDRYIENDLPQRKSDHQKFITHLTWWKSQIGEYSLARIDNIILSQYRDKLANENCLVPRKNMTPKESNKKRSNATVNRYLATLSIVFSKGVSDYGWIDDNPVLKVGKKTEPKGRTRFLEDDEVCTLLQECYKESYELYLCVLIALSTGARYSEITNLTWKHVDLKHRQFHFIDTKNGDDRGVSITSEVYEELLKFQKVRKINSDYLFSNKDGTGIIYITGQFEKAVERAKLTDFHFHDLRHTAASFLAKGGASLLEIATILGHKTLQMVQRYAHLTKNHTAVVLENMNKEMFKGLNISGVK